MKFIGLQGLCTHIDAHTHTHTDTQTPRHGPAHADNTLTHKHTPIRRQTASGPTAGL